MKSPKKPKKPIDIHIDTKHIDVDYHRDSIGNVTLDIDTPIVDAHYKKKDGVKQFDVDFEIDDKKEYEFISSGSKHMPKNSIWKITGEMLKIFLAKKIGHLKK